jgi:hypothetical protein
MRFLTMPARAVPFFLALALGLGGCGQRQADGAAALSADEEFLVQQYLRIVDARRLAALGDSLAEGRFAQLAASFPEDSLRAVAARISAERPERWPLLFEEIVRRKQILESQATGSR